MKHQRTFAWRAAAAGAGAAAFLCGALVPASADPAPSAGAASAPLTAAAATELATSLEGDLKDDMAGAYYDAGAGKLVVNVLGEQAAEKARKAGAEPRIVRYSLARLGTVQKDLAATSLPGTARAVDHRLNKVVVSADSSVEGEALSALRKQVAAQDGKAVLKRVKGEFRPFVAGGDAIWRGDNARCTLGLNVTRNGLPYFLTAGHCGELLDGWSTSRGGRNIGITVASSFPGDDHSLVRYTARVDHPSRVNLHNGTSQAITRAADPIVGQRVWRSGSTTGVRTGEVVATGVSVTYPQGTVHDLIQTTVCAEPGDSGGPLFSGETAHGLTSGGSGNCRTGGTTFHQPVTEALRAHGVRLG
ncbi:S1 family peptidase [Streptomyces megasporus]|uniref:S1 family peptidase n=1 Tax=Streptomyces megasporus TaxID=44060 RepID=UPI0004E1E44C|nr:S1 family peptidase [Streptomyces megasporus]